MPEYFLKSSPKPPLKRTAEFLGSVRHPIPGCVHKWDWGFGLGQGAGSRGRSRCRFWMLPFQPWKGFGGGQGAPGRAHTRLLCHVETRKIDSQSGKQKLHPSVLALPSLWRGMAITLITLLMAERLLEISVPSSPCSEGRTATAPPGQCLCPNPAPPPGAEGTAVSRARAWNCTFQPKQDAPTQRRKTLPDQHPGNEMR